MPVVQSGALEPLVGNLKAERTYQMQYRTRAGAGSRDVSGVLRNLRLDQYNIEHSNLFSSQHGRCHANLR